MGGKEGVKSGIVIDRFFSFFTHFGDSALLVPLSVAAVAILAWSDHKAAALRFAVAVGALMAAIVLLKVGFYAVGGDTFLNVLSPSGHAGLSVTVYGCGAVILAKQLRPVAATAVIVAVTLLLAAVLESRIVLLDHTPEEVAMGTALGLLCVGGFLYRNAALQNLRLRWRSPVVLGLAVGVVAVWIGGHRLNAEDRIEHWGTVVGTSLGTLPPDLKRNHRLRPNDRLSGHPSETAAFRK